MAEATIGAIGLVLVAWSLVYLARQTRVLAQQGQLEAEIAANTLVNDLMRWNFDIEAVFLGRPELRPYFYDGKLPRDATDPDRQEIMTLAFMYADFLNTAVASAHRLSAHVAELPQWGEYADTLLKGSPALGTALQDNPRWWPHLQRIRPAPMAGHAEANRERDAPS